MKHLIFLIFSFLILSGCEELPFTDEDIQDIVPELETTEPETEEEQNHFQGENETPPLKNQKEISINIEEKEITAATEIENLKTPLPEGIEESLEKGVKVSITDNSLEDNREAVDSGNKEKVTEWKISRKETERQIPETEPIEEKEPLSPDEITIVSGVLELEKDTVIQNRRVVLNMVTVKTFEHDLTIRSEEFVSNHSVIQNFPEKLKAKKGKSGRNGGDILIETGIAQGKLQLVLNGENAGRGKGWRKISKRKREKLRGKAGRDGRNAVYRTFCKDLSILVITVDRHCWEECVSPPTMGEDGGDGKRGLPGLNGKRGGDSGSFHLKAFELSDFQLTSIKKNPGIGSKGSKGSYGGLAGRRGSNGSDSKMLCDNELPYPKRGKKGKKGPRGKDEKNGREGKVCLEKLFENQSFANQREENIICY